MIEWSWLWGGDFYYEDRTRVYIWYWIGLEYRFLRSNYYCFTVGAIFLRGLHLRHSQNGPLPATDLVTFGCGHCDPVVFGCTGVDLRESPNSCSTQCNDQDRTWINVREIILNWRIHVSSLINFRLFHAEWPEATLLSRIKTKILLFSIKNFHWAGKKESCFSIKFVAIGNKLGLI